MMLTARSIVPESGAVCILRQPYYIQQLRPLLRPCDVYSGHIRREFSPKA